MTKRIFLTIFSLFVLFSCASAHSGRTDNNGGHYVTATGEYHFHHGYPAHQHPGGICPYLDNSAASEATSEIDDYGEGYDIGYNDGYEDGYNASYEAGRAEGRKERYAERYKEGYEKGHEEGTQFGYDTATAEYNQRIGILAGILFASAAAIFALTKFCIATKRNVHRLEEENWNLSQRIHRYELKLREIEDSRKALSQEIRDIHKALPRRSEDACKTLPKEMEGTRKTARNHVHYPPPLPSQTCSKVKTFGNWAPEVHVSEKQFRKFLRANQEPLKISERDGNNARIIGKSGCSYETSLNHCSCPDFEMNEHGKAPCKHIYFLAMQLGIPVKDIFEEYIQP